MFEKFGEGFYVTTIFMTVTLIILITAMITDNEISKSAAQSMITVLGMIAAFWFPSRGQTTQKTELERDS